ncbi:hypothetical protein XENTR_v10009157 [Xenopus tropicalis]|uniref:Pygopus homolog 1 isoform X1 n=1 Tax=Xenopus tropicalis TaxID=8364 RepID=A0A8J0QTX1_XENTR|nr:pygopus homolog 1 isoform X1 [Xenopus tropicalis]KAE8617669.1 hypothetical protein XENTR_v10009157 [Xenopus tropicalis]|eukprot:XP_002942500.2 PREDICTED: pygopus homolog 1 isoform X1 [Xenopus tropicalis]
MKQRAHSCLCRLPGVGGCVSLFIIPHSIEPGNLHFTCLENSREALEASLSPIQPHSLTQVYTRGEAKSLHSSRSLKSLPSSPSLMGGERRRGRKGSCQAPAQPPTGAQFSRLHVLGMSAPQEKEPCKRARGDDGFDGIIRPGLQGSPEKKKRKSSLQTPVIPLISEYAPPANTSSDHLIASNPFDDEYNISSSPGYQFLGNSGYVGVEDYGSFRIPQNTSPRTSTRFCTPYAFRDHLRNFPQDGMTMAFGRPSSFSMGIQENTNFQNQLFFSAGVGQTITMPGQHFRCNRNDSLNPVSTYSSFQSNAYIGPGHHLNINQQLETSHTFLQSQSHLMHPKTTVSGRNSNINCAPQNSNQDSESIIHSDLSKSHKSHVICTENFHSDCADVVNGGQTTGNHGRLHVPKSSKADVTTNEKCNKWLLHSSHCGHLSSELLYSCGICSIEVSNLQDAIMCEVSCQKWFHRSCTGLTEIAYALLTAETSAIWGCDSCMAKKDVQLVHTRKSIE